MLDSLRCKRRLHFFVSKSYSILRGCLARQPVDALQVQEVAMKKSNLTEAARWRPFVLFAFVFCFPGTVWAAGPQKVADVQISPGQVTWKTYADAEGWTLTISGQGIYLRERYEERETPSLRPLAPDGERFPDGSYNWELRAINPVDDQEDRLMTRRVPGRTRQIRTERGTFERKVVRRSVVASGSFRIQGGGFVMPRLIEEGLEGR